MCVDSDAVPAAVRCSEERLTDGGVFLLENRRSLFLWVGQSCPPDLVQRLVHVSTLARRHPHHVCAHTHTLSHTTRPDMYTHTHTHTHTHTRTHACTHA